MVSALEIFARAAAEVRKQHRQHRIPVVDCGQLQTDLGAIRCVLVLDVPLALLAPAKADRALGDHELSAQLVEGDRLPLGIVRLAQAVPEVRRAHEATGHVAIAARLQADQERHVGVAPAVVLEVRHPPLDVELLQDDVAHRHRQGGVGARLWVQPQIRELGSLAIVGRDHHALGAFVADLGVEVGIRRPRLRHVRAPQDQALRVVPVRTLRHVGLLAEGLGRGRRQIAIPVVEAHAGAADQRQIARTGGIGDHRHGRDRREADHAVWAVGLDRVDVRGADDLVDLGPGRAHEAAHAPDRLVVPGLVRVLDDRGPGLDRPQRLAGLAPELEQPATDQRVFQPVAAVQIPGVARPPRAAARLVVRHLGPGARIVGLLGLPGDQPVLDVDLPAARAGAVGAMGRAHDLVVLPALPVAIFPGAALVGDHAVSAREPLLVLLEEHQAVDELAHDSLPP